jgi:hypothetical protein
MPLYKVSASASYIAYSKGAVIMVKLSELAGENKLNAILRLFIQKYRYPHRAITLDFCNRCISIQTETIIKLLGPCLQSLVLPGDVALPGPLWAAMPTYANQIIQEQFS